VLTEKWLAALDDFRNWLRFGGPPSRRLMTSALRRDIRHRAPDFTARLPFPRQG
jgi:hypothetical protein